MPTFAILGFIEGGTQVMAMAEDPAWVAQLVAGPSARRRPRTAALIDQMVIVAALGFPGGAPRGAGGAGRALALGAPARHRPADLSERPRGRDRARPLGARGEPDRRHPARLGVRRPRPLLDLPHPGSRARRRRLPPPAPRRCKVLRPRRRRRPTCGSPASSARSAICA